MASSADSLSFADDKLKHGGYWAGDQGLVAIDRRWIIQAVREASRILREMLAGSYSCFDTRAVDFLTMRFSLLHQTTMQALSIIKSAIGTASYIRTAFLTRSCVFGGVFT
jgi:hypothetical protein